MLAESVDREGQVHTRSDAAQASCRKSKVESRKPQASSLKPQASSLKPQAESRKPKAESRKPKAESRKPPKFLQAETLLAGNLRFWRNRRGLSTVQAAQELGICHSTWSQWEREHRLPSLRNIILLCQVLDVPLCAFLTLDLRRCVSCLETTNDAPSATPQS